MEFNLASSRVCHRIYAGLGNQSPVRNLYWASVRRTRRGGLANKRRISEEFIGFDLSERDCLERDFPAFSLTGDSWG